MSEKPLCGHCYQDYHEKCCDTARINVLERQLSEAREENKVLESNDKFIRDVIKNSISPQMYGFSIEQVRELMYKERVKQLKEQG